MSKKEQKSRKWIEYDIVTTVMMIYKGEYAIDCAQSVKVLRVSMRGSDRIMVEEKGKAVQIKQVLN